MVVAQPNAHPGRGGASSAAGYQYAENRTLNTESLRLRRAGFTLIELLLVLVILAILAAIVVPMFVGRAEQARVTRAQTDISNISSALDTFEIDNGSYPTTAEGLQALIVQPPNMPNWHGPYLKGNSVPLDPWGHPYQYRCPGQHSTDGYDLYSYGPSGRAGGAGEITNWGKSP